MVKVRLIVWSGAIGGGREEGGGGRWREAKEGGGRQTEAKGE